MPLTRQIFDRMVALWGDRAVRRFHALNAQAIRVKIYERARCRFRRLAWIERAIVIYTMSAIISKVRASVACRMLSKCDMRPDISLIYIFCRISRDGISHTYRVSVMLLFPLSRECRRTGHGITRLAWNKTRRRGGKTVLAPLPQKHHERVNRRRMRRVWRRFKRGRHRLYSASLLIRGYCNRWITGHNRFWGHASPDRNGEDSASLAYASLFPAPYLPLSRSECWRSVCF